MSKKHEDGTPALRRMLLSAKPSDFGLTPTAELPRVWAAMMEMRLGKADVSLVAVAEGSTSLYFSRGGGIIGGGEHDSVRAANHKWLVAIDRFCNHRLFALRPRSDRGRVAVGQDLGDAQHRDLVTIAALAA